jgi:hypothetical protein
MKIRSERVLDNRPHPSPLPQERENRLPSHNISSDWISRKSIRKEQSIRLLFPLPGGEGQGEGGCNN